MSESAVYYQIPWNEIYVEPDENYAPYMEATKQGFYHVGGPRIGTEGLIQDPEVANVVGYAAYSKVESAREHERAAIKDQRARSFGERTLTFIGGEFGGLAAGPFLTARERQQRLLCAASDYRNAHMIIDTTWREAEEAA